MATSAGASPAVHEIPPPASAPGVGALRRHVNLARELAVTQFKLKYTGSVLGYVWSLLKPMMTFAILFVVFDKLFHLSSGTDHYTLQLLVAIVLFTFFQETTGTAMNAIASNGNMIRKAYFPRIILVIAATVSSLMTFTINMTLIIVIAAPLNQIVLGWRTLLAPVFFVELYLLVLGVSMLLSSLFVFYRDVGHIWEVFTQLLIYGSAVMFPIKLIHTHWLEVMVLSNPLAQIIEDMRHALVTPGVDWSVTFMGWVYVAPLALTAALVALGFYVFNRLTPRFAEYL